MDHVSRFLTKFGSSIRWYISFGFQAKKIILPNHLVQPKGTPPAEGVGSSHPPSLWQHVLFFLVQMKLIYRNQHYSTPSCAQSKFWSYLISLGIHTRFNQILCFLQLFGELYGDLQFKYILKPEHMIVAVIPMFCIKLKPFETALKWKQEYNHGQTSDLFSVLRPFRRRMIGWGELSMWSMLATLTMHHAYFFHRSDEDVQISKPDKISQIIYPVVKKLITPLELHYWLLFRWFIIVIRFPMFQPKCHLYVLYKCRRTVQRSDHWSSPCHGKKSRCLLPSS